MLFHIYVVPYFHLNWCKRLPSLGSCQISHPDRHLRAAWHLILLDKLYSIRSS